MDDTLSQILHACKLARELEANLPNLANQPRYLLKYSCEDVVRAFNQAIHELNSQDHMLFGEASGSPMDLGFREGGQAMDLLHLRGVEEGSPLYMHGQSENEIGLPALPQLGLEIPATSPIAAIGSGIGSIYVSAPGVDSDPFVRGRGEQRAAMEGSSSGYGRRPAGSSGQRSSRKRKESSGTRTTRVPALRTGNMDIPPDDGYTWRKYGQKDILGSRFPRSYYRCTHKNFYGCEAKKQVQRLDEDPYTYEVTYCGDHTCQTSPTPLILPPLAPNNPPPQGEALMPESTQPPSSSLSTSIQLGSWFNRDFDGSGQRDILPQGGESSTGPHVGSSDCPVTDLADVMFNSSSSGSSMDAIFSLKQENWRDKE